MDGWFNCHRKVNRVEKVCLTKGLKSPNVISYISVASAVNGQLHLLLMVSYMECTSHTLMQVTYLRYVLVTLRH